MQLPQLILFDLGGVLIDVDTRALQALGTPGASIIDLWETWLTCPAVKQYESGKIGDSDFARGVLDAFGASQSEQDFLASFAAWPIGFYAGVTDLLVELRKSYKLAYLSNSNQIHFPRFQTHWGLDKYFDYHFASYRMGCVKPDADIFAATLEALPFEGRDIFFVDDNRLNVEQARKLGIPAEIVRGPHELRSVLGAAGILKNV
jgi:glucose-1-phosphatase